MHFTWVFVIFFSILGSALGSLSTYLYKIYRIDEINDVIMAKHIETLSLCSVLCYFIACSICVYSVILALWKYNGDVSKVF